VAGTHDLACLEYDANSPCGTISLPATSDPVAVASSVTSDRLVVADA
jgi:hypothetical protein